MNRIAELRKKKKMNQKELGSIVGVAQNTICNWENEKREPDYDSLIKMADYFGVSVDFLLGRDEKMPPSPVEDGQERNVMRILGRDGSRYEGTVSDSQRELFKQMLDNLKPVDDENL